MVVGAFAGLAWLIVISVGVGFNVDGFLRVGLPAESSLLLEAKKYVVYYESVPAAADGDVPAVRVQVFDTQTEREVPVEPYRGSLTYETGRHGSAIGTVTLPHRGLYRIVTTTESLEAEDTIAFGESVAAALTRAFVGAVAIWVISGLLGLLLLIATAVRRSRVRRVATAEQAWRGIAPP